MGSTEQETLLKSFLRMFFKRPKGLLGLKRFKVFLKMFNGPSREVPEVLGDIPKQGTSYRGTGLDVYRVELMAVRKLSRHRGDLQEQTTSTQRCRESFLHKPSVKP